MADNDLKKLVLKLFHFWDPTEKCERTTIIPGCCALLVATLVGFIFYWIELAKSSSNAEEVSGYVDWVIFFLSSFPLLMVLFKKDDTKRLFLGTSILLLLFIAINRIVLEPLKFAIFSSPPYETDTNIYHLLTAIVDVLNYSILFSKSLSFQVVDWPRWITLFTYFGIQVGIYVAHFSFQFHAGYYIGLLIGDLNFFLIIIFSAECSFLTQQNFVLIDDSAEESVKEKKILKQVREKLESVDFSTSLYLGGFFFLSSWVGFLISLLLCDNFCSLRKCNLNPNLIASTFFYFLRLPMYIILNFIF
jgi:hypothetical protein